MDTTGAESTTPSTVAPTPTPDFQTGVTPTPSLLTHTVQPGQTVESIAALYGVTVEALLAINNLSPANTQAIVAGAVLTIPSP
jgi:LysM repeat protein